MKKDLSITPKGVEILKEKETHLDTKKISDKWMSKYVLAKKYYEHYGYADALCCNELTS